MRIKLLSKKGTWREIADSARTTINLEGGKKEPTSKWKSRMLMAEHSPIRQLTIKAKWYNLPYWVSVHFVRHKFGIEHWVRTQRSDRTGVNRDDLPQGAFVEHEIEANAQAIITISRKRLCYATANETRAAWALFLDSFKDSEPELYGVCVKECVYRGFCPEYESCGYFEKPIYQKELCEYRSQIAQEKEVEKCTKD